MNALKIEIIPVTPFQQNCAIIWNGETGIGCIVDPGGDVEKILAAVERAKIQIEAVYLTHGHLDHAGGATAVGKALGVEIIGPALEDKFLLESLPEQAVRFGLHNLEPVRPDRWLSEGDMISIGGETFDVLHCPGHTPGHVVFINRNLGLGIFGDVLFRNSVGRTDFEYGDHEALISAIKTKLMVLPDGFAFICGHGVNSTIGAERRSNPFVR